MGGKQFLSPTIMNRCCLSSKSSFWLLLLCVVVCTRELSLHQLLHIMDYAVGENVFYWCVNLNQWFEGQVKSKRKENGGITYDLQCYANGEYLDVYSSPEDRIQKKTAFVNAVWENAFPAMREETGDVNETIEDDDLEVPAPKRRRTRRGGKPRVNRRDRAFY